MEKGQRFYQEEIKKMVAEIDDISALNYIYIVVADVKKEVKRENE